MKRLWNISCLLCCLLIFNSCSRDTTVAQDDPSQQEETPSSATLAPEEPEESDVTDPVDPVNETVDMANMTLGIAMIEYVDIEQKKAVPYTIDVVAKGHLADGCTDISEVTTNRSGSNYTIKIRTKRPKDKVCTQAVVPFERNIPIDVEKLSPGKYTLDVNGYRSAFIVKVDRTVTR